MVGYAVGEIAKPSSPDQSAEVEDGEEEEEEEEEEEPGRWQPGRGRASCYEVVTAWVHPRYICTIEWEPCMCTRGTFFF